MQLGCVCLQRFTPGALCTCQAEHRGLLWSTEVRPFTPVTARRGQQSMCLVCVRRVGALLRSCRAGRPRPPHGVHCALPVTQDCRAEPLHCRPQHAREPDQRRISSGIHGGPHRRRRASRGRRHAPAPMAGARARARRPAAGQVRWRAAGAARRGRDAAHADRGRAVRAPGAVGRGARPRKAPHPLPSPRAAREAPRWYRRAARRWRCTTG